MSENQTAGTCSCRSGCCAAPGEEAAPKKHVTIDLLYLDLDVCTRCQGAEINLEKALEDLSGVLKATNVEVEVNKINVLTKELALAHQFVSSPTIRVNGQDIQMAYQESRCESCGDLCGDEVDCRVWTHQGKEYNEPPAAMIIEALLQAIYGAPQKESHTKPYVLPENLARFYESMARKQEKSR